MHGLVHPGDPCPGGRGATGTAAGRSFVYTVRHTGDAHYRAGTGHGDGIWEHGGFAVHFFSRDLVDALAESWTLEEVAPFEEGDLPRRLWRVTQTVGPAPQS
ncbi:hypothetical protein OG730_01595 [Streptomyces sp. NBC_01298]|uniref:hypothetical protein n=1 Tax=Streptomyces sp. NBC_01298 TaxID=2903817 RepID=UPI002E156322|nr:hypothetical protein OG730_01595 [Streptomyces sp. NBC_01298]